MSARSTEGALEFRVALIWNQTIQEEVQLAEPQAITLGAEGQFPLPEGVVHRPSLVVFEPTQTGYCLRMSPAFGGSVWLSGQRREVAELGPPGASVPIGPEDYGVITLGPVALFFQYVRPAKAAPRAFFRLDATLVASVGLSLFLWTALILVVFLDYRLNPPELNPYELDTNLITRFMVTPPPEDILEEDDASGTETEDPGLRGREEEGGKKHEGDEGRVGKEQAEQEDTHIQGEVTDAVSAKVRNMGLLGALSGGGEGNAIAAALDVPNISDIVGGMGAAPTVVGRGSRGAGLRGVGTGGGGTGPGSLFGAGKVGTGIGAGRGTGVGRGSGGVGVKGRKRSEVKVGVTRGKPRVNGYLSAEQINRVVRANQAAIKYCYEVEVQRQPNLRGRVEINWRIALNGTVSTARVARSTLRNARVEGCMVRQIRRWRFPQPDGGQVTVTYPFIFGVKGG